MQMPLDMASVITNGTAAHKSRGQPSGIGGSISINGNDHAQIATATSANQQGFGSGKSSWNPNIWGGSSFGNSLRDTAMDKTRPRGQLSNGMISESTIEGKTGSGSLLATSESEGWVGRSNLPWALGKERSHLPGPSRGNGFSNDASTNSSPSYFPLARACNGNIANGSPTTRPSLQQPDALAASTGNSNSPGLAGLNGYTHQQANTAAFLNNVGVNFGDRSPPMMDNGHGALAFPQLQSSGAVNVFKSTNNQQTHFPHGSTSTMPDRPIHSNRPSIHSDMNDDQGHTISQAELHANFAQLQLNNERLNGYTQAGNVQRPTFYPHLSHDGTFARLANPAVADDHADFRSYTPETSLTDSAMYNHIHARLGARTPGSPAATDYTRSMNGSFYSTAGTPGSGNQFSRAVHNGDRQADFLDRKLRNLQQEQQEILRNSANQFNFNPALNFVPCSVRGIAPLANLYHVSGFGGLAHVAPRTPHREDSSTALRSPLLEEFRANSKGNKRYELKDIYNHIVEFSGDQHGSRFIQQKLETANSDEKEQVFQEIKPNAIQLMMDVFGNYVIQKLFEHGNQAQKKALAQQMMGHILALSTQMYGCRVVQKALEHVLTDQQAAMVKELENHVMRCVKDQNGNHVIQKAIERVPMEHIQFIVNDFKGQVHRLAAHPYGCRVIQRMLEHCHETDRQSILAELHSCTVSLIPDQFGNYVIQHVIQNGDEKDRSKILSIVISQLLVFSKHKFASNVVEKSIEYGHPTQRAEIMQMLLTPNERGESPLLGLMRDQYGNYVIQKVLDQVKDVERCSLVAQIEPLLTQLKKLSYGKQIAAIERLIYQSHGTSTPLTPTSESKSSTVAIDSEIASGDEATGTVASSVDTPISAVEPKTSSGPPDS